MMNCNASENYIAITMYDIDQRLLSWQNKKNKYQLLWH